MKKINKVIDDISKSPKFRNKFNSIEIIYIFDEYLGKNLRSYVTKRSFSNGVLQVNLNSSVLRNELSFKTEEIIDHVNRKFGKKL